MIEPGDGPLELVVAGPIRFHEENGALRAYLPSGRLTARLWGAVFALPVSLGLLALLTVAGWPTDDPEGLRLMVVVGGFVMLSNVLQTWLKTWLGRATLRADRGGVRYTPVSAGPWSTPDAGPSIPWSEVSGVSVEEVELWSRFGFVHSRDSAVVFRTRSGVVGGLRLPDLPVDLAEVLEALERLQASASGGPEDVPEALGGLRSASRQRE
ncbi:MAG: hypothetical protein R3F61_17865 [Myxococcota bacterium]